MNSIRISNLRSLSDTGYIKIKPITILLGKNSSGKSTFLRTLPLLKQSIEASTTGPILWYGRLIDFGSIREATSSYSDLGEITFGYKFNVRKRYLNPKYAGRSRYTRFPAPNILLDDLDVTLELVVGQGDRTDDTSIKNLSLCFQEHSVSIDLSSKGKIESYIINGEDFTHFTDSFKSVPGGLLPHFIDFDNEMDEDLSVPMFQTNMCYKLIDELLKRFSKYISVISAKELTKVNIYELGIGSSESMISAIKNISARIIDRKEDIQDWTTDCFQFISIRNAIIANKALSIIPHLEDFISGFASNSHWIAPIRATAERYYRPQGLAVDSVDPHGKNLAMFLLNLTNAEFKKFSQWSAKHFNFSPTIGQGGGHISIKIKEGDSESEVNLADMGFGYSQILPILTQLWILTERRTNTPSRYRHPITFVIEQPELHLHPKMQAQLADVFMHSIELAKSNNIKLNIIMETHSEVLVTRFGHKIVKNQIKKDDINVVLFNKEDNAPARVTTANFDERGFLNNWPAGFLSPGKA